jgi:hypothetical protein
MTIDSRLPLYNPRSTVEDIIKIEDSNTGKSVKMSVPFDTGGVKPCAKALMIFFPVST